MVERKGTILIVDDEEGIRKQLYWALKDDFEILQASEHDGALEQLQAGSVDLVLLDLRFPPHLQDIAEGKRILDSILERRASLPVIIMTGDQDRNTAVEMVARGAFDLFRKPVDLDELGVIVKRALRMRRLEREVRELRHRVDAAPDLGNIIGVSPAVQDVLRLVRKVANTEATILITGESGTGKELIARALHKLSSRSEGPFVALNCSAIPATLVDDELFGHEKGAFTGATALRQGKFEFADGGTLFLDEVGDLPGEVQRRLLRVLQESEIQRLGGNETIRVNVRLVAATHQDLQQKTRDREFREDLYYRLKVVHVNVPSLRERTGDVPLLVEHFFDRYGSGVTRKRVSPAAMDVLSRFSWPGNVRQLENTINALSVTLEGDTVELDDLPAEIRGEKAQALPDVVTHGASLEAVEKEMIRRALAETDGNRTHAARLLGISRHQLLGKLKRHGLD